MENKIVSNWTGSANTADLVRRQIIARWGVAEANNYDPKSNCLTFNQWLKAGFKVRKGEKAIRSFIIVEKKDVENRIIKYPRQIFLFYFLQVEKIR